MNRSTGSAAFGYGVGIALALTLGACQKTASAPANAAAIPPDNAAPPGAAAPADTTDSASAKAFLDGLYDHYKTSKNNNFDMFDRNAPEVFDNAMLALLAADTKALNGDLGVIDGDWLCDCQDFVSLKAIVVVQSATPTTAKATAQVSDTGMPGEAARRASFDLVKQNGTWRIHDMADGTDPSLRTQLEAEIKQLKPQGSKKPDPNVAP